MDSEKRNQTVDEKAEVSTIPYVVFESCQARNERHIKRLMIIIVILIGLLFISNVLWLWYESSYDYADYEVTADNSSNANFIGSDMEGDINNGGKNKSEDENKTDRSEGQENPCKSENR